MDFALDFFNLYYKSAFYSEVQHSGQLLLIFRLGEDRVKYVGEILCLVP